MDEEKVLTEEEQKLTWKDRIFSEKTMSWVNVIFILIVIVRMPLLTIIGCALWLAYLVCGIVIKKNLSLRIAYGILALVAIAGIVFGIMAL